MHQKDGLIEFNLLGDIIGSHKVPGWVLNTANVQYFLPPLSEEINTLDKFMRKIMSESRSTSTQYISVNRTATIDGL